MTDISAASPTKRPRQSILTASVRSEMAMAARP